MPAIASAYLTPPQIGKRLSVDSHRVLRWIRTGQLTAVNIGDGARRPRFRISESDLAIFLASRSAGPQPKAIRRRRKDPLIHNFF